MKKSYSKIKCGFYSLLLLVFFSLNSCNNKNKKTKSVDMTSKEIKAKTKTDSLTISVKLKTEESVFLNFTNKNFDNEVLKFVNSSKKDTIVSRTIPVMHSLKLYKYGFMKRQEGGLQMISQNFLIHDKIKKIDFELKNNQLYPIENDAVLVTDILEDYKSIFYKIIALKNNSKIKIKKELDSLYTYYQEKYQIENRLFNLQLNDIQYMRMFESLYPKNKTVDAYVKEINLDLVGSLFIDSGLGNVYIKNRVSELDYPNINSLDYSDDYKKFLAANTYKFLIMGENKGKPQFKTAIDWLKTTEFYKKDSVYIKKQIQHLSNDLFKEKIKNLRLSSVALKESSLSKIIQKHPSPYYLIDFWATWCAPCISGIKEMKKMNFPKNVKILSLSVDKEEVKEKWQLKTKELEQNISYLIDNRIEENKEFLKFIELNSIPRYILIDKNMNLIDQSFLPPHDPQFLPKLRDVRNAKFW